MKIVTISKFIFFTIILTISSSSVSEQRVERPCKKSDLIGTWVIHSSKGKNNIPEKYKDLIAPYQVRIYKKNNEFLQLSSNNKLNKKQALNLLSVSQQQTYVVNNGLISTINNKNILEQYDCSYFFSDFPEWKIKKGTLSLWWSYNDKPIILNTYVKY